MDNQTNFIYSTRSFDELIRILDKSFIGAGQTQLRNYALNRWYNFWSAYAVEQIFCSLPGVKARFNPRYKLADFSIRGITFDHKSSIFPQQYPESLDFAMQHPASLAEWLYRQQSVEKRQHFANRLFIVFYNQNGEHWKLKSELKLIKLKIEDYILNFNNDNLLRLSFETNTAALSDIIWIIK
jgi:hypothetical protein